MAYETGSASSPSDLLDKLRAFLLTNGWTINSFITVGSGKRLHIQKGSCYYNFRAYHGETLSNANDLNNQTTTGFWGIGGYPSNGYSGASNWNAQPGCPLYANYYRGGYANQLSSAIPTYHFFTYADITEVHVVIEFVTGKFQHINFGNLQKYNASASGGCWMSMPTGVDNQLPHIQGVDYPSGAASMVPFRTSAYTSTGVFQSSLIRVNIDNHDGWAFDASKSAHGASPIAAVGPHYYNQDLETATTSPYSWQTQLLPYVIGIVRSDANVSPFGEIKHLRELDITNYIEAEEIVLGPDTWKVFPLYQKGGYSLQRGIAIRKVA